jgi:hypothetical protein
MQKNTKVGGDIDAWCTKCKMLLGHTVLAMVGTKAKRVRCNTCQGEHNYRGTTAPVKRASSARDKPVVTSWEALLAKKDVSRARKYSTKERFGQDEVLNHPVFGIGLVQEVRGDKIEVAFKADVKTLVHGKF